MDLTLTRIVLSGSLAGLVAFLAFRMRALDRSGAIAAFVVGSSIFLIGGLLGSVILLTFFISGSLLTQLPGGATAHSDKSGRTWFQVIANALVPITALYATILLPEYAESWSLVFAGAFATATADTWATEIGSRYGTSTYSLTSFATVPRGESGGVTMMGLLASLAGATVIGLTTTLPIDSGALDLSARSVLPVLVAGTLGSVLDSIAGSTMQARFRCQHCGEIVETPYHCGAPARHVSGIRVVDNSAVNLITCLAGGLIALLLS